MCHRFGKARQGCCPRLQDSSKTRVVRVRARVTAPGQSSWLRAPSLCRTQWRDSSSSVLQFLRPRCWACPSVQLARRRPRRAGDVDDMCRQRAWPGGSARACVCLDCEREDGRAPHCGTHGVHARSAWRSAYCSTGKSATGPHAGELCDCIQCECDVCAGWCAVCGLSDPPTPAGAATPGGKRQERAVWRAYFFPRPCDDGHGQ